MIMLAHAGHWAVQLIYLFPFAVLVGVILVGRIRDRRVSGPAAPDGKESAGQEGGAAECEADRDGVA